MSAKVSTFGHRGTTSSVKTEIVRELVNATDGAGLHFDGAAGNIDIASPPDLGTKFSFEFVVKADAFGNDTRLLVDFGNGGRLIFGSDSSISYNLGIFDNTSWKSFGVKVLDDLKVHHLTLTVDGTSAKLYDNGNEVGSATISASHGIDSCADAKIATNFVNTGGQFEGTYYRARFFNRSLSISDVQTAYERADVDYADQYGSQTDLTTNGPFASDSDWTKETGWTIAGGKAVGTNVPNNQSIYQSVSLSAGKRYQIVFEISGYSKGAVKLHDIVGHTSPEYNANGTYTFEFVANAGANSVNFRAVSTAPATTSLNIEYVTCRKVGAVSDYDLAFANPTQSLTVQDRSGAADGTASTSGVTQVQPVVQLNSTSARIGTTAATPADGEVIANDLTVSKSVDGDLTPEIKNASTHASARTSLLLSNNTSDSARINYYGGNHASANDVQIVNNSGSGKLRFYAGGSDRLTLDASGNVTQNGAVLKVERDDNAPALQLYNNHDSPADGAALGYVSFTGKDHDGTANQTYANIGGHCESNTASNVSGYLTFNTTEAGTATTERMRISSTGEVGIACDPANPLQVEKASAATSISNAQNDNALKLSNYSTAANGQFVSLGLSVAGTSGASGDSVIAGFRDGDGDSSLRFYTENGNTLGERMRIHSSGGTAGFITVGPVHGGIIFDNTSGTSGATRIQQSYSGSTPELRLGSNVGTTVSSAMNIISGDAGLVKFNGGISFGQTNSSATGATADASTLSHYEVGRWTPKYQASAGNDFNAISYGFQDGHYVRVGNICTVSAQTRTTNVDQTGMTTTADLLLGGLPFPAATLTGTSYGFGVLSIGTSYAGNTPTSIKLNEGASAFNLQYGNSNNHTQVGNMTVGSSVANFIGFQFTYQV